MAKTKRVKIQAPEGKKIVLHIGCGSLGKYPLHASFAPEEWHALYVDDRPRHKPDIHASWLDLSEIPDDSVDGVWCPYVLPHHTMEEIVVGLKSLYRVLKFNGRALFSTPNAVTICENILLGNIEDKIITTGNQKISPLELLFGYYKPKETAPVQATFKSLFTAELLGLFLRRVGFSNMQVKKEAVDLVAACQKIPKESKEFFDKVMIMDPRQPGPSGVKDELDRPPVQWRKLGLK